MANTQTTRDEEMEQLRADMKELRRDVKALSQTLTEEGRNQVVSFLNRVVDRFHDGVEHGREYGVDTYSRAKDYSKDQVDKARGGVRSHPLGSIFAAAGAGMLLGWLFRRKD